VARRPSAASREKDPAAAGIRRYFSLEQRVEKNDIGPRRSVVVVVVVARLLDAVVVVVVARHLLDAVVVVVAEITNSHPSPPPSPAPSLYIQIQFIVQYYLYNIMHKQYYHLFHPPAQF